jgi:hypothetical protein
VLDDLVEDRVEQPVLAAEVVVDLRLVRPGLGRDPVHPRAGDAVRAELLAGCLQQSLPGRLSVSGHAARIPH